jgi:hypothetical protein
MTDSRKWFGVKVKDSWKAKVMDALEAKSIICLSPIKEGPGSSGSINSNEPGLLECMLFVKTTPEQLDAVMSIKGVDHLLFWRDQPAVIKEKEILLLRYFTSIQKDLFFERIPVRPEAEVIVTSGPFLLKEGDEFDVKSKAIKAELPSLGYVVAAEVDEGTKDPLLVLQNQDDLSFINGK